MSTASDRLDLYLAAERAILSGGQEVRMEGRLLRAADLTEIRNQITVLSRQVAAEQRALFNGSTTRFSKAVFND